MRFELEGTIEGTEKLDKDPSLIGGLIDQANKDVLRRGVPKGGEGASVSAYTISGELIRVKIEGTRFVYAHDALKRLKNFLSESLARQAKIGLRKLMIEKYVMEVPASPDRLEMIKVYSYVERVEMLDGEARITLRSVEESVLDRGDIGRLMKFVAPEVRTIQKELASRVGTITRTSKAKTVAPGVDPTETALRLGWVERYPGRGQWFYMPQYAVLQSCLRDIVIEEVTKPRGFVEIILPKILPLDLAFTAKKIQGEPGGMFYVCPPRVREKHEYVPLQVISEITRELPIKELKELLEDPGYVLDPAQCTPFYQLLRNKTLRKDDLPIKVFDCSGPTYRYEAGGVRGLERLSEFWRIEHVWLGTPEQVEAVREELIAKAVDAFEKSFELEWRIQYAGDTFYLAEDQKIDEDVDVPQAPKYEWQFYLPFKGDRESDAKDVWLACASFNSHGNHYTKNFGIKCTTGEALWTGCFGVGTTRLTAAFLAQKGFDFDAWPEPVKRRIGKLPSMPKPV